MSMYREFRSPCSIPTTVRLAGKIHPCTLTSISATGGELRAALDWAMGSEVTIMTFSPPLPGRIMRVEGASAGIRFNRRLSLSETTAFRNLWQAPADAPRRYTEMR